MAGRALGIAALVVLLVLAGDAIAKGGGHGGGDEHLLLHGEYPFQSLVILVL